MVLAKVCKGPGLIKKFYRGMKLLASGRAIAFKTISRFHGIFPKWCGPRFSRLISGRNIALPANRRIFHCPVFCGIVVKCLEANSI